jgi:PadR family transcriptional regulator, regulatory protein PadR
VDDSELDLLRGTLDLLILKGLAGGPMHGYLISKWVRSASRNLLNVEDRALYIALHRLEERKLVKGKWQVTEAGRRVKRYELTDAGRKRLTTSTSQWERYVEAMTYVLRTPETETP